MTRTVAFKPIRCTVVHQCAAVGMRRSANATNEVMVMSDSVFDKIDVRESKERKYIAKPTPDMLSDFENSHSITLPTDYKDFCLRFGAGELAGFFRIYSVIVGNAKEMRHDLDTVNESVLIRSRFSRYEELDITQQFLVFAGDIGGDFYAWSSDDLKGHVGTEVEISYLEWSRITKVASSFTEFVEQGCVRALDDPEWEEDWSFGRFFQRQS